jgi:hypothetical protein
MIVLMLEGLSHAEIADVVGITENNLAGAIKPGTKSFEKCDGSETVIEDRELENWREEWASVATPLFDLKRKVRQKIERQNRRFVAGNVVTAIAFLGILTFAAYMRSQAGWMGTGWASGICALVVVSVALRLWNLRGTWRAESQSTRAFAELWLKRVQSRIRLLRVSMYVSVGWLVFCAVLTAVNWPVIGKDVKARPKEWIEVLILCVLMQPVIWYWATWLKRRKLAELGEVKRILNGTKE